MGGVVRSPFWVGVLAVGIGVACDEPKGDSMGGGAAAPTGSGATEPSGPADSPAPTTADSDSDSEGPGSSAEVDAGGPSDCPPTRIVSDVSDKATVSGTAVNLMVAWCGACHTPDGAEKVAAGPSNVADFNGMIDEGYVVDCSSELSPIIISMRSGDMPPPDYLGFGPASYEIDLITAFIEFGCSDEEKACAVAPSDPGCDAVLLARRERRCSM
jgi:mono/diheme cytochrome c family protein